MIPTPPDALVAFVKPLEAWITKRSILAWLFTMAVLLLGFRWISPNDRIGALEQHDRTMQVQVDSLQSGQQAILSLVCVQTTPTQHHLARVQCP